VLVMYAGLEVEQSPVDELFAKPQHPYTIGLLGAVPRPLANGVPGRLSEIPGMVPVLRSAPAECVFAPRCSRVEDDCRAAMPSLTESGGHRVACLHPGRREAVVP
jgi:peptide/nickel transport system ATP-binding protein